MKDCPDCIRLLTEREEREKLLVAKTIDRADTFELLMALQADLARTWQALREQALGSIDQDHAGWATCGAYWDHDENEIHRPVTINGEVGPCPARKG